MAFLIRENYYLCTRKYKRLYKIMKFLKKYLLDILAVVMFAVISFVYFMPADIDGRILYRHMPQPVWAQDRRDRSSRRKLVRKHVGPTPSSEVCRPIRWHLPIRVVRC